MTFFFPNMNAPKFIVNTLCLSLFLLFNQTVSAVEIIASLDRNPVQITESFQLTFTATETPDDDPDFSPLNHGFEILQQSHRSNSSWVNGQSTKTMQWVLSLMAKQTGQILIPAIAFGDDVSQPASIKVTSTTVSTQSNDKDLFLDVEVSTENPYVQSQVIYTLRLYRKVQLAQASLTEPAIANAVIEKLTEDKNYDTQVNGVAYVVTERQYAIFPQKSGVATIEPLVLTADIVLSNSRQRFNGFFNRPATKTKRISSKAITLDVLPAADSFKANHWIPAEQVHIEEKWSGDITNMKLGEPLTRTLTLLAQGTTVAQLPELLGISKTRHLKTYPDQPILKEKKSAEGIIAFREEKIAYIPSKPGSYILPAIEIPWFNTRTQQMEIARIPEISVTATGSITNPVAPPEIASPIPSIPVSPETISNRNVPTFWMWFSLFLASGWLITLFLFFKKPKTEAKKTPATSQEKSLKASLKQLKKACSSNDQLAAKTALLTWGKINYNSHNLAEIAAHCEASLSDEIYNLNSTLYAKHAVSWQGEALFQLMTAHKANTTVSEMCSNELEPLYKQ